MTQAERDYEPLTDRERDSMIRQTYKALMGNGNPSSGLVVRFERVERQAKLIVKLLVAAMLGWAGTLGSVAAFRMFGGTQAQAAPAKAEVAE